MIVYKDLPRSGNAPSTIVQDIAYTIQFYSSDEEAAMRGTDEGNFEAFREMTVEEYMKPLTVIQEFRSGKLSPRDNQAVKAVSNRWSYEFYAKAAYQGLLEYIPNALTQPTKSILRMHAFDALVNGMINRDLYDAQDLMKVKAALKK